MYLLIDIFLLHFSSSTPNDRFSTCIQVHTCTHAHTSQSLRKKRFDPAHKSVSIHPTDKHDLLGKLTKEISKARIATPRKLSISEDPTDIF